MVNGTMTVPCLERIRTERAIGQRELARMANLTQMTVWRIEHGHPARLATIRRLAEVLRVKPSDLTDLGAGNDHK
jgi:transcriptional regulator with XRE-family HTH domain